MQSKLFIDTNSINAVIFDLDGTIVNNMSHQTKAWLAFASKYNRPLTEKIFKKKYSGLRSDAILDDLFEKELSLEEIKTYRKERGKIYQEIFEKEIAEVNGVTEFLKLLKSKKIKIALATTASLENRNFILDRLKLRKYFDVIIGGEHVKNGKPDPEIYKLSLLKLKVPAEKCIAFEDSLIGIKAATGAGIRVIAILTTHKKEELSPIFGTINDFTEVILQ